MSPFAKRFDIDVCHKDSVLNTEGKPVLIGGGTDGASVNVGVHNGMKAQMQETLPWRGSFPTGSNWPVKMIQ